MSKKTTEVSKKKKINFTEEKPFEFLRIVVSILTALAVTFVLLCFVTDNPVKIFFDLLTYPLKGITEGNFFYFGYVLAKMIPLCFAGLATLLYFRTGLFNLSTEGVFYMSGVFATWLAINENIMTGNSLIDSAICIIGAGVCGGLIALIPGFLKAKLNADEIAKYIPSFAVVPLPILISNIAYAESLPAEMSTILPQRDSGIAAFFSSSGQ